MAPELDVCKDVKGPGLWIGGEVIEQALFFTIGFLVALFAAVVATPIFSRRATRLAKERARIQAPMTEKHAVADRDSLLAIHAVELVRLEHRLANAEDETMRQRAAIGRQSVQIVVLEVDAAERERLIIDMRSQIENRVVEQHDLEVAVAAGQVALHDAFSQRDRAQINEEAARLRCAELEAEANRERARIAILAARAENLEELLRSVQTAKEKAEKPAGRSLLGQPEELLRRATGEQQSLREGLQRAQIGREESRRRLAEAESRLERSERLREEILIENGRQLAALADRDAALKTAQAKAAELEARLADTSEGIRVAAVAESIEGQKVKAAQAATQTAGRGARENVEALRHENDALRMRIPVLANAGDPGDRVALRAAIEHLGREVNRLYSERKFIDAGDDPRQRNPSGREETTIAESQDVEVHRAADAPRRRSAGSHAVDL